MKRDGYRGDFDALNESMSEARLSQKMHNLLYWTAIGGREGRRKSGLESNMKYGLKTPISPAMLKRVMKDGLIEARGDRYVLTPKGWSVFYDQPYIEVGRAQRMDNIANKHIKQRLTDTEDLPVSLFDADYNSIGVTVGRQSEIEEIPGKWVSAHDIWANTRGR